MTDIPTAPSSPVEPLQDPAWLFPEESSPADLRGFASTMAARLPGWTARAHDLTVGEQRREVDERVWDNGTLSDAFEQWVPHEAAVLTGPGGAQFVAVHRPGARGQFLVGALRPASIPAHLIAPDDSPVPSAIAVGADPVRAAAEVRRRLLPPLRTSGMAGPREGPGHRSRRHHPGIRCLGRGVRQLLRRGRLAGR
ncbi:hypothetical protein ACWCOZ_20430 [Streptomyces sp. NPDC001840]